MSKQDAIVLRGIRARGFHGVLPFERVQGQEFIVDVELIVNLRKAAKSDDVKHTIDYSAIAEIVVEQVQGEPVNLIETLAERIAKKCLAFNLVREVTVTVNKPQAPLAVEFETVAVRIKRKRK